MMTMEELTKKVSQVDLTNYDEVKPLLRARLYNKTKEAEVFASADMMGFEDLIVIPYVQFTENAAAKVTNSLLETWDKGADEIIQTALENSKADVDIESLSSVLAKINPVFASLMGDDDIPVWVIRNKSGVCGAISAIVARDKLREMYPNGYIVLPSSIHEVLVVGKCNTEEETAYYTQMVTEINADCVDPKEKLSDKAYEF